MSFGQEGLPLSSSYEAWFIKFARDVFARKLLLRRDGESVRSGTWESVTLSATGDRQCWLFGGAGRGWSAEVRSAISADWSLSPSPIGSQLGTFLESLMLGAL